MIGKFLIGAECVALSLIVLSTLAHRLGLFSFKPAIALFALGVLLSLVVVIVGIGALLFASVSWKVSAGALTVGLLPIAFMVLAVGVKGFQVPRIHDISTDLDRPLVFTKVPEIRAKDDNSIAPPSDVVTELQRQHYPDIKPLLTSLNMEPAFQKALMTVSKLGWEIVYQDGDLGLIEAVDETVMFGFKDDVVIRVSDDENGSRVDMRSVSRVGLSDLGANAKRIRRFQKAFNAQ